MEAIVYFPCLSLFPSASFSEKSHNVPSDIYSFNILFLPGRVDVECRIILETDLWVCL